MKVKELETKIKKEHACFFYTGPVVQDGIEGMAQTLLQILKSHGTDMKQAQSVFSVFIEMTQNVMKYSAEQQKISDEETMCCGTISVGQEKNGYFITCANLVTKEDADSIAAQLDHIIPMTREELRAFYKLKIYDKSNANPRGAGLGLIEIAKLTDTPPAYSFEPVDDTHVYYILNVKVGGNKHV